MVESQPGWIGRVVGGRYRIEAQLGQGGMSTVFQAADPNLHRTVAVKLIHSHLSSDPEFVRRFEQEAAAVAQLRHPNIIQVYDFDHDDDLYYMILEHVPGETLHARLHNLNDTGQVLSPTETVRIMSTICDAVAYAHQRGMIHRDLKPANVMLNTSEQPILMDFGVAKMLGGTHHTATGDVIGTVSYMAPEQARGERPDERADIYSLGVMLFELVTGRRPFEADSAVSIMMKHLMEPVPDILQIKSDAPRSLITVIERALAKSPADRYQTAADMATAIRAALKMESPTDARQYTAPAASPAAAPRPASEGVTEVAQAARPAKAPRSPLRYAVAGVAGILAVATLILLATSSQPGTPALPPAEGMLRIDGGVYLVGLDASDGEHAPLQQTILPEFWIDRYEVTNEQYAEFVSATSRSAPVGWSGGSYPESQAQHPVQGVAWLDAAAFCEWASKRLPTEAEWEVAARGPENHLYPWGNNERAVELPRSASYPVGSQAANRSRYGAFDMAGNVWEWVGETYAPVPEDHRVLRGGAYGFLKDMAYRLEGDPNQGTMIATAGFRCAAPRVSGAIAITDAREPIPTVELAPDVLFYDDFTNPDSGWPIGEEGEDTFGYHPQAFYHLEVGEPNGHLTVFRNLNYNDFIAEVSVLVDHTDTESGDFRYGLAFRRSGDRFYAFMVSPRTQTWRVVRATQGGSDVLADGAVTSLRGLTKAPDKLRVDANGPALAFQVNGQVVAQIDDAEYADGEVGFVTETADETLAHVHFSSLTIRQPAEARNTLFVDDFSDPGSGWPSTEQDNHFFGYHPPDFYHVEVNAPSTLATVFRELNFDDFTVEAEIRVDHTDTDSGDFRYGLAFRRTDDAHYAFMVSVRSGVWQVLKRSAGDLQTLAEGRADSLRGSQGVNDVLRVDANGASFAFHINGEQVAQLDDSELGGGEIGFVVETFDETLVHVHYDAVEIRQPQIAAAAAPTAAPEATPTAAPTPTPVPVPEGMALVPAGYFQMGSSTGRADERPEHPVLLDTFYIDLYEVTNAEYRACVDAGDCTPAGRVNSFTRTRYRDDPAFDDYPVIGVTWDQALAYCGWVDKRLPTEAEWEYAASGPENLIWPWGNTFDASLSAASAGDTQPVGSYPGGRSPFGVFDMAGNVTEWVADVYNSQDFFENSPPANPLNTGGGDTRIFRGGSFANRQSDAYRTSRRFINNRGYNDVDIGVRCAKDAPDANAAAPQAEREALVTEFCRIFNAYKPDAACP
jgi:serine/threonine-protein kinase